jgi:hypothetical protein
MHNKILLIIDKPPNITQSSERVDHIVIFGSTGAGGVEEFRHSELFRLNDEAFGNELAAPLCSTRFPIVLPVAE